MKTKNELCRGTYTAIVTPFTLEEDVDWKSLEGLIEFNIANKITGIVPCGTTGESPTLDYEEHDEVIRYAVEVVAGRVPVIAGTGSNGTREAIKCSRKAEESGADALLLVNPYYNKPTQEGLFRHFGAIANQVGIPIVLYNIKGRTGVNLETDTLLRLIENHKNIVAVKEASGDLGQIRDVIKRTPEDFYVFSGDDNLTMEVLRSGGDGVVSVASNAFPDEVSGVSRAWFRGDHSRAEELDSRLRVFYEKIFVETNPIPVKYILSEMGMCNEVYRLPMCELFEGHKRVIKRFMAEDPLFENR